MNVSGKTEAMETSQGCKGVGHPPDLGDSRGLGPPVYVYKMVSKTPTLKDTGHTYCLVNL